MTDSSRIVVSIGLGLLLACASTGLSSSQMISKVEGFRDARDAEDYDRARSYLTDDARVWYDSREGDGFPVKLGRGLYKDWDEHFHSHGELGEWTVNGNSVWTIAIEENDYYRLLERTDTSRYRVTYYFDDSGLIEGYMVSAAYPDRPSGPSHDRSDEFEAWARKHHPDEWEYLRPGGKLDPTGDRAERTRLLLNEWRASVGLEPIE